MVAQRMDCKKSAESGFEVLGLVAFEKNTYARKAGNLKRQKLLCRLKA